MEAKVALVTGGSQGYGKEIAGKLSDAGMKVVLAARDESKLNSAMLETRSSSVVSMDVTSYLDWETKAVSHIEERYGRLDVLVNNAGGAVKVTNIADQTYEDIDKIVALNLSSAIYGTHAFAGMMKRQKSGLIINISSACAKHAWPGWSVYAAAKWGIVGFSKNSYVDLQPYNIRVTCITPGAGATDFMKHAGGENLVMKLSAQDVAKAVLYVSEQPEHVFVEEIVLFGNDQIVIPL